MTTLRRNIKIIILTLLLPISLYSQDKTAVYNKVKSSLANLKTVSFSFSSSGITGSLKAKGTDKFVIQSIDRTIVSNGKTIWNYNKKDNSVILSSASDAGESNSPQKAFFAIKDNCTPISLSKEQNSSGESFLKLKLAPKSKNANKIKTITLKLNPKNYSIIGVDLDAEDGMHSWKISNLKINEKLADKIFEFKAPKGAKINDMR